MFCPNCGQQQASDETRFCSRCGFQLGVVKAALAAAGEGEEARGQAQLGRAARDSALPPARAVPAAELAGRQFDTAEVAEPPSVAERTTNLLGRK